MWASMQVTYGMVEALPLSCTSHTGIYWWVSLCEQNSWYVCVCLCTCVIWLSLFLARTSTCEGYSVCVSKSRGICVYACVLKSLPLAHTHRHLLRGISLCEQKSRYARSTLFFLHSSLIGATVSIITMSIISLLLILIIIVFHETSWWFRVHEVTGRVSGMESALFIYAGIRDTTQFCHAI